MSNTKKILSKLNEINSKLDSIVSRLDKLESKTKSPKNNIKKTITEPKVGKIVIDKYPAHILITGNTFDIRNQFKVLGAKWDGESKGWKIPLKNIDDYEEFKNGLSEKCNKLKENICKNTESHSKSINNVSPVNTGCMIESSDEEDSY